MQNFVGTVRICKYLQCTERTIWQKYEVYVAFIRNGGEWEGQKIRHHYLVGNVTKPLPLNASACFTIDDDANNCGGKRLAFRCSFPSVRN